MEITDRYSVEFGDGCQVSLPLNFLQRSIFPVIYLHEGKMTSLGTAFAISNHGLCMTAAHVLTEVARQSAISKTRDCIVEGVLGILYVSNDVSPNHSEDLFGGFTPITKAYSIDNIDIAILHINLPRHVDTREFVPFPLNKLRLAIPDPDARLIAFGYEKGEWISNNEGGHSLSQTFTSSSGFMRFSHPAGRDAVMLPMPCFQTSLPLGSGMSGGPIISEDGFVVGVASTGFDLQGADEAISYASPIAPAMFITLEALDENGLKCARLLWDFAEGGAIVVDKSGVVATRHDITLTIDVAGGRYEGTLAS